MLQKLEIQNFKRFQNVTIALGSPVVFVGPNNSGKTTALQALTLWELGIRRWKERHGGKNEVGQRSGATINRNDVLCIPVPSARQLWAALHTRTTQGKGGDRKTEHIFLRIRVSGVSEEQQWTCGMEFYYANAESFYCRPFSDDPDGAEALVIPDAATRIHLAYLPPMSGLASHETRLDAGAINVRVGEGRTAEVLRNLCYMVHTHHPEKWDALTDRIAHLFGVLLAPPVYNQERGEIEMQYAEKGAQLDLSSSGRGLQQILLLLAYLSAHTRSIILLDEPDAHLEILRQRQVFQILHDLALENGSQLILATHSEVILNEAMNHHDTVISFAGRPHALSDQHNQALKALRDIGYEHYLLAEQRGWVLYLEGATDLRILQEFARRLDHQEAMEALERPFVHYVGNVPNAVRQHFHGLRAPFPELLGIAIFDHLDRPLPPDLSDLALMWTKREIENYLCQRETFLAYAITTATQETDAHPLFGNGEQERRRQAMAQILDELEHAAAVFGQNPWSDDSKVSDKFMPRLFEMYHERLQLFNTMRKGAYYRLVEHMPAEHIDPEIRDKLDAIASISQKARERAWK